LNATEAPDPSLRTPSDDVPREIARLLRLAWPVVLGQVGLIAMNVVDLLIVGRLGEHATATVGLAQTFGFGALALGIGACAGIDPLVAQANGAGQPEQAVRGLLRGGAVVAAMSVPIALVHWYAHPLLELLGQPASTIEDASRYARALIVGIPPFFVFQILRQYLQGVGRMRTATVAIALGNAVNALGSWALVYGHLGFPALGPLGSAWSTVAVRWVMALALLVAAWGPVSDAWPGVRGVFAPSALLTVAAITLPVGLQVALEFWAFNSASFMAGWLGPTAQAAHTVGLSLASASFMVPLGISAAAATRVGNLVGARVAWTRAAWTGLGLGACVMLGSAVIYASFPGPLAALYNPDARVVAAAAAILPVAALFQVFDGTQVVGFGVLRGLGDTRLPTIANVVGYGLVGLPAGYLLAFRLGWGLPGVWAGLTLGLATVAVLLVGRIAVHARRASVGAEPG
jgi:MATE family multidrug resistance protein